MNKRGFIVVVALMSAYSAYAQKNSPYLGEVVKMINAIKGMNNIQYQYKLKADFPDGTTDQVDGDVYLPNGRKHLYNNNDAFTVIYTDSWYYNADHRKKTVSIVNLNKHLTKEYKASIEKEMFGNVMLNLYLDSVIVKHAQIKSLNKNGDTVNIVMGFPDKMPLKSCSVSYDEREKTLIRYSVRTFQAWRGTEYGKNKGTTKEIICYNFKKAEEAKKYEVSNFFSVNKEAVTLKKYKKYNLNVKL